MEIKLRLLKLGKKQVDLLEEVRKRGYRNLYPTQLSQYILGKIQTAQAEAVLEICRQILVEWENERK